MGDPDASDDPDRGDDDDENARRADGATTGNGSDPLEDANGGDDAGRDDDPESAGGDAERDRYGDEFAPDDDRDSRTTGSDDSDADASEEYESLREKLDELRDDVDAFEAEIEDRTVHRQEIEDDLRSYVRRCVRRGHARGWGPYLVLLYGTAMTIGAFVELSGIWAILAMIVIWLSTLGLYTLMVLVGVGIGALSAPGRAMRAVQGVIDTFRHVRS